MLNGKFENCYGLKKFDMGNGIDFSSSNKAIIYAPNGVMKTSFTQVFEDLSKGNASKDRIFFSAVSSYTIKYYEDSFDFSSDNLNIIPHCNCIYVINSFSDNFEFTRETVGTLLADEDTRRQYNDLMTELNSEIKEIESYLALRSGYSKAKIKDILISDFELSEFDDWPDIVSAISKEAKSEETLDYLKDIKMSVLFHEKAINEYKKEEFKKYINLYISRLSSLLQKSEVLTSTFTDRNADNLTKLFGSNNLFLAKHKILLRNGKQISDLDEWKKIIKEQLQQLHDDMSLKEVFEKLKKNLTANNEVEEVRKIIINNRQLIPLLFDIKKTKKLFWCVYCSHMAKKVSEYLDKFKEYSEKIRKLYQKAEEQSERWQKVVNEFNRRFRVPFTVQIKNKSSFILKDAAPNISFEYTNGLKQCESCENLTKDFLFPSLSMGEKRAMYLLYILFDLERIRNRKAEDRYLIIADDIADSFDYKNKYAIIEYLSDLSKDKGIDLLILTHNFDFYRTVSSRLSICRNNCFIAQKLNDGQIKMSVFQYQKDFFKNVIINGGIKSRDEYKKNKMLIASIPFYRNLTEYCGNNDDYEKLTCFLHYKTSPIDTGNTNLTELWNVIHNYAKNVNVKFENHSYYEKVQFIAKEIINDKSDEIALENKLILSIASRLRAEKYMRHLIMQNVGALADSSSNQMQYLYEIAKGYLSDSDKQLIDDINLITPETIHLNTFMYEPLIDVSIWVLSDIYERTQKWENIVNFEKC